MSVMPSELLALIDEVATQHKLDTAVIRAIVQKESGGVAKRNRFEPAFKHLLEPFTMSRNLGITQATEEMMQMTSWGLMQVMGAVAREHGFRGYLQDLSDERLGLDYGCRHFKKFLDRPHYTLEDAISSYNQGGPYKTPGGLYRNETYVDKVLEYRRQWLPKQGG